MAAIGNVFDNARALAGAIIAMDNDSGAEVDAVATPLLAPGTTTTYFFCIPRLVFCGRALEIVGNGRAKEREGDCHLIKKFGAWAFGGVCDGGCTDIFFTVEEIGWWGQKGRVRGQKVCFFK